jgi:hypothetical protein
MRQYRLHPDQGLALSLFSPLAGESAYAAWIARRAGVGPRVGAFGFERIPGFAYTAPCEDITLNAA